MQEHSHGKVAPPAGDKHITQVFSCIQNTYGSNVPTGEVLYTFHSFMFTGGVYTYTKLFPERFLVRNVLILHVLASISLIVAYPGIDVQDTLFLISTMCTRPSQTCDVTMYTVLHSRVNTLLFL